MGASERVYLERARRAFAEIDDQDAPPASPEDAFRQFLRLMESVMPLIEKLPRPGSDERSEPDEIGFYRRWRTLAAGRRHA